MQLSKTIKNIIAGVLLVGALVGAYILFVGGNTSDTQSLTTVAVSESGSAGYSPEASEATVLLNELKGFSIGAEIFSTPSWKSLKDFRVAIPDEPKGRSNPFLALVPGI